MIHVYVVVQSEYLASFLDLVCLLASLRVSLFLLFTGKNRSMLALANDVKAEA